MRNKRTVARRRVASTTLKPVMVTVTDEKLKDIQRVADTLTAKGMKIDRVMPVVGTISGSVPAAKMSALRAVTGVMSVEEELAAELPSPDSPLQ